MGRGGYTGDLVRDDIGVEIELEGESIGISSVPETENVRFRIMDDGQFSIEEDPYVFLYFITNCRICNLK